MNTRTLVRALGALALVAAHGFAGAQITAASKAADRDPPIRYNRLEVTYEVADDATSRETRRWQMTVLKPQVIDGAKRASVTYSTSVQKAEVLEAYTLKADGRRVDVPKDNYQVTTNQGRTGGGPAFSDYSTLSVVFPDLAVGDSVVFGYRLQQSEAIFPGQFDAGEVLSREVAFDQVRMSVEYPAAMKVRFAGRQMEQSEQELAGGRRLVSWQWRNLQPRRSERRDYSVFDPDKEVGFTFSTFPDHAAIAAAYGLRAVPKAVVTPRISALAQQIVGSQTEPRAQAKALAEWVSEEITYGGNCVGVGTVVPRDLDVVLDNKMGDCKDHATLLQALLAARGIPSQQALVNAGNQYELPSIPRVSAVNHVINYLPSLGLFTDSTASGIPFGTLPMTLRGKPVLLVGGEGGIQRLPVPAVASQQTTQSDLKFNAKGDLSGRVQADFRGDVAIGMRGWARNLSSEDKDNLGRDLLQSLGLVGQATVSFPDPTALSDQFSLTVVFDKAESFLQWPGSGAFNVRPLISGLTVEQFARPDSGPPVNDPGSCSNGIAEDRYRIELPKGMKVSSLPPKAKWASTTQSFEADYQLKGQTLTVRRRVEDRTPGAVCDPDTLRGFNAFASKVYDHLRNQVIYR